MRARTLKSTGLTDALKKFETARNAFDADRGYNGQLYFGAYLAVAGALQTVDEARIRAVGLCNSALHGKTKALLSNAPVIPEEKLRLERNARVKLDELVGRIERSLDELKRLYADARRIFETAGISEDMSADAIRRRRRAIGKRRAAADGSADLSKQQFTKVYSSIQGLRGHLREELEKMPPSTEVEKQFADIGGRLSSAVGMWGTLPELPTPTAAFPE